MFIIAVKISDKKTSLFEFKTEKDALGFQKDVEKAGFETAISDTCVAEDSEPEHWFTARKRD